jgi:hypothetical protein
MGDACGATTRTVATRLPVRMAGVPWAAAARGLPPPHTQHTHKPHPPLCAVLPQRARTISSMVCAVGALRLISTARMPNSSTWMVAPEAYQKGPETPYCHATLELREGERWGG